MAKKKCSLESLLEKLFNLAFDVLECERGVRRRSSAWLERRPGKAEVPGSNPGGGSTIISKIIPSHNILK